MSIEEQVAMAKESKLSEFEQKQIEKIKREAEAEKLKANKKFLKEGKVWYTLFNGKDKEVAELKTYMAEWCMDRTMMGPDLGLSKDFVAGVRHVCEMMDKYPKEYAKVATELGAKL